MSIFSIRRGLTAIEMLAAAAMLVILTIVFMGPAVGLFTAGQSQLCLNNVKAYEVAKNAWCADNFSTYSAIQQGATNLNPTLSAIAAYLPGQQMLPCPTHDNHGVSLGTYLNVTSIGVPVTCSLHGTNGLAPLH